MEDQLFILTSQLPTLLNDPQYSVRLCVVDSVSALFRGEFSLARGDSLDRARMVFAMGKQMKRLSHEFALPFVVTNQVRWGWGWGEVGWGQLCIVWEGHLCRSSHQHLAEP